MLFSCQVIPNSLQPQGLQYARLPCPSPSPGVCPSSYPLNQWCYLAISSSVTLFSFCIQSFPASGSFPMSQLLASGGQSTGASALASVFPKIIQGWFLLSFTVWSPCCPRDSQESSPVSQFESINSLAFCLLYLSNSHIHTWQLERP